MKRTLPPQAMGPATPLSDQSRTLVQQAIQDTMSETVGDGSLASLDQARLLAGVLVTECDGRCPTKAPSLRSS